MVRPPRADRPPRPRPGRTELSGRRFAEGWLGTAHPSDSRARAGAGGCASASGSRGGAGGPDRVRLDSHLAEPLVEAPRALSLQHRAPTGGLAPKLRHADALGSRDLARMADEPAFQASRGDLHVKLERQRALAPRERLVLVEVGRRQ